MGARPRSAPQPAAGSDPDLAEAIRSRIRAAGGRITFAEFMDLALYDPEHGYYMADAVRSAREGDFLTAAELHPIFGGVIAGQLAEMWDALEHPPRFTLREYGAGPGTLGLAIVRALAADRPDLLDALTYDPIEVNPAHRRAIGDRFAAEGLGEHLAVREPRAADGFDSRDASDERAIVGCVLANEFVDAFPVHRVRGTERGIEEQYVTAVDRGFAGEWAAPSTRELSDYLESAGVTLAPGQLADIDLAAAEWLDDVSAALERGYLLVIDYGHPAAELYSTKRFAGTLLGYREHAVVDDPFAAVGRQDLTAHVDFTTLSRWAAERGLAPLARTTQARFLVDGGLERLLGRERERPELGLEEYLTLRSSIGRLLDPRALGGFGVLLFGRDVPADRVPSGFGTGVAMRDGS